MSNGDQEFNNWIKSEEMIDLVMAPRAALMQAAFKAGFEQGNVHSQEWKTSYEVCRRANKDLQEAIKSMKGRSQHRIKSLLEALKEKKRKEK